jgi:HPt (histidine-containing phosphotransfer) domain-containing protein
VSDSFEQQLSGLRRRFCDRAMGQSADLERLVSDLEDGGSASQLGADIREIAHSLAGAGGVFGFAELSARAGELDDFARHSRGPVDLAKACRAVIAEIRRADFPRGFSRGAS